MSDTFTCPFCTMASSHPKDVLEGYCGNCHRWTGQEWQAQWVIIEAIRGALAGIPDVLPQALVPFPPDALVVVLGDTSFRVFVRALRPPPTDPQAGASFLCTRLTDLLGGLLGDAAQREGDDSILVDVEGFEHRITVARTGIEVVTRVRSARERAIDELQEYLHMGDDSAKQTRERVKELADLIGWV